MSYLGQVELKSSEIRRIDVTSSTSATHTLTWTPPSEQSLIITINGIKQQNNYTISGTTLTLDTALAASDEMEVVGILDIGTTNIPADDSITNAMVKSDAAIAQSKLALDITNSEVNASAAIAKSKLASLDVVNADVNASAAIAQSKLVDIVNADIDASAAIVQSKLATLAITDSEIADNAISGNKIDGGTISNFASTGIDDNGVSTALTIDSSGRVGVGVAPAWNFHVESSVNSNYVTEIENTSTTTPQVLQLRFGGSAPDDNTSKFLNCGDTAATRMIVYSDGDVVNADNSYGGISDVSLKQDIVDASPQWDDIKALRVRKFRFKEAVIADPLADQKIGLIAQEVEPISPGLVYEDDGIKGMKYSVLYMKAVKALQEAMERIEILESRVSSLEGSS